MAAAMADRRVAQKAVMLVVYLVDQSAGWMVERLDMKWAGYVAVPMGNGKVALMGIGMAAKKAGLMVRVTAVWMVDWPVGLWAGLMVALRVD